MMAAHDTLNLVADVVCGGACPPIRQWPTRLREPKSRNGMRRWCAHEFDNLEAMPPVEMAFKEGDAMKPRWP